MEFVLWLIAVILVISGIVTIVRGPCCTASC